MLQKLIENGDDFQSRIMVAVMVAVRELSISNQYADEETSSNYGYLSGYEVQPVAEQVEVLKSAVPEPRDGRHRTWQRSGSGRGRGMVRHPALAVDCADLWRSRREGPRTDRESPQRQVPQLP